MAFQGLKSQPNSIYRWILPLICCVMIIALFQFTSFSFPDSFGVVADSSYLVIPGVLSFLAIALAITLIKKRHIDAIPISLFATSMLCFFGGEQLWTIYKTILDVEPFPSAADFFYLSAYPFFSAFFLYFMKKNGLSVVSKKVILFGVVISASILYPTFLSTYEFNIEESSLSIAVALAYPVLDAVLLGLAAITTLVLFQEGRNYFWIMVNLGIFVWILTNTLFLYAIVDDTYYDGHPVDFMWLVSFILWSFAVINYHNHLHNEPTYQLAHKSNTSKKIAYQAIKQYVIPIFVGIIVLVSIFVLNFLGTFENLGNDQTTPTVLLIFAIMITFSGIILVVNKNLTALVKIRERELQEKNELLLKSERFSAIGEVSARIAHDIRNPLAVLKNSMEMILARHADQLTQSDNESVSTIKRAITRITHQVDDVLDYVREQKLNITEHQTNAIIKNAIAECPIPENLLIEVKPSKSTIRCDAAQIQRVFVNLLLNAAQSIDKDGKITIRTIEDNNWIHFEFEDTGPGIPVEIGSKIFEPLVTSRQTGTGLGLAICKRIVEQHWGKINYKNNPTVFAVSLPRHL